MTSVTDTPGSRKLAVIAIDDIYPGSLASAIDVLQIANAHVRRRVQQVLPGAPRKRSMMSLKILSPDGAAVRALGGLRIEAHESVRTCRDRFDAVIVPAVTYGSRRTFDGRLGLIADLFPWLREQRGHGAIFAACSTGIMLLAEAGLLDDHAATISINLEREFRRRYPAVKLDLTRSIVEDRDTICAAAPGNSLHLVLKVVERLRSGVIARQTARALFFHELAEDVRPAPLHVVEAGNPLVERAQYWLIHNLSSKLRLEDLARMLSVSERTLFRRFKKTTGLTPNMYLQNVRIDTAKSHLELTDDSIDKIAASVGYGDKAFFSKVFRQHTGLTPRAYRTFARRQHAADTA